MLKLSTIPMEVSPLRFRLADPQRSTIPTIHLQQIQPLDQNSSRQLMELAKPWYAEQPFTQGYFSKVTATRIDSCEPEDVRLVRKWLYQRGIPFGHRVLLSWDHATAAITN